jgi:hypothetical protein
MLQRPWSRLARLAAALLLTAPAAPAAAQVPYWPRCDATAEAFWSLTGGPVSRFYTMAGRDGWGGSYALTFRAYEFTSDPSGAGETFNCMTDMRRPSVHHR